MRTFTAIEVLDHDGDRREYIGPSPITCPRDDAIDYFRGEWCVELDRDLIGPVKVVGVLRTLPATPIKVGEPIGLLVEDSEQ